MRRPLAIANWKMEMTLSQSAAFVAALRQAAGGLCAAVETVLFPPCTALHAVREALAGSGMELGAQNVSVEPGGAYTGQLSAALLADAGCRWAMLGHWEVRRHLGDDDDMVRRKVRRCLEAGLQPLLLIGPGQDEPGDARQVMEARLARVLGDCRGDQVAGMAFMYEPEGAIGGSEPEPPEAVAAGCRAIRAYLRRAYGDTVAEAVRVVYGGSVTPDAAPRLLASPEVDGLGVGRKGREARSFAAVIRAIAQAKGLA